MYNPFSLEGKTILVTGASSGIGKATAIECSKMGAKVVLTGRNETKLMLIFQQLLRNAHQLMDLSIMRDLPSHCRLILSLVIKWSR